MRWDELAGSTTSSAIVSVKLDEDEGNRSRLDELQPSPVSRSALPNGQLNEKSEELLVLVEGIAWWLMFLLHSPVCLMTEVAHEDRLQSEGGLVAFPFVDEGPAELADEEGDGEEDDEDGSLTAVVLVLLFGAVAASLTDDFRACRFGMNIDRSEDRLSLEFPFRNASICCWRRAILPLPDADDEEDEEEQDGPSTAATVASSRLADRFTLTADFVVLLLLFCCSLLLVVLLELDGFPLLYGCLLLVGVDASC